MGLGTLAQVLRPLQEAFPAANHPELLVGLDGSDDAAVYRLSDEVAVIQTLDFFPPVVDDPFVYGQIAAANAMSDVFAMGGEVLLALNIAAFPEDLDPALLGEIFRGGADKVLEAGGVIAGGHTLIDREPKYGLSVTGLVHPAAVLRKAGAQPGDALLLTKPLGTGVLLTAAKERRPGHERGLAAAIDSMRRLSRHEAHLARAAGAHAMTDVTGFGLLGHAAEVAERSGVQVRIDAASVPLLPDALRFAEEGALTGGGGRNLDQLGDRVRVEGDPPQALRDLLYDPQTSGGLLIALPEADAGALIARIREQGGECWRIGGVAPADSGGPLVVAR
jgi:selenide,water dikinase